MSEKPMTATDIRLALANRFKDDRRYAIAEEVGITTGGGCRRLDMIVMDCYWSNSFRIDGFEIKISTSDLRRELEDPEKHVAFFDVLDFYTLACPAGVVDPLLDIIPKKWGILIINDNGTTRYKRKPLALVDEKHDRKVPRGFMASITRAIQEKQPSQQELEAEYKRGLEEGEKKADEHRGWMSRRVQEGAKKLEEYDKIVSRFELWKARGDIEKILDDFEAFMKLDPSWVKSDIEGTIKKLERIRDYVDGKVEVQDAPDTPGQEVNPETEQETEKLLCPFCKSAYIDDNIQISCRKGLKTNGRKQCRGFAEREDLRNERM